MLNNEQEYFINAMIDNINNEKFGEYLLEAPAGCGKTFCCKHILNGIINTDYMIIAPTHKAKTILQKTNKNVTTIHKFLRGKMEYTRDGDQIYRFNPEKKSNCIIFIDECSMIGTEIYELLVDKYADQNFLIFSGDPCQLPPIEVDHVESDVSESYVKTVKKSKTFNITNKYTLHENMRARENPLGVSLINRARNSIQNKMIPDFISKIDLNYVLDYFKNNVENSIVIAYSNVRVNWYNQIIRTTIFDITDDKKLEDYYKGEKLVYTGMRKESKYLVYSTGAIIEIVDLDEEQFNLPYHKCYCMKCDSNKLACKKCKIAGHRDSYKTINFWKITDTNKTIWYKPKHEADIKNYKIVEKHFKDHCKFIRNSSTWAEYYAFVNAYNADLRYNYACTFYKSQGDEWDNVFIDRDNLIQCVRDTFLKLTAYYTGISRMVKNVYEII